MRELKQLSKAVAFLSPWLIGFVAFVAGPILASLYLSLNKYNVILAPEWIGARK